jgi:rod shape-determining protein MreC
MSRKLKKGKNLIIIFSLTLILLFSNQWGGEEIKEEVFSLSSPLLNLGNQGGYYLSQTFSSISEDREGLEKENKELRQALNQLLYLEATNQQLKEENWLLEKALLFKESEGIKSQPVQVITQNLAQDWILVNRGEKDGLSLNQPVVTFDKALVGKIVSLTTHSAKIELISHPNFTVEAESLLSNEEENSVRGLIRGKGGSRLKLEMVPLTNSLEVGTTLVVSNLSPNYPAGFLIGRLQELQKNNTQPFQEGEVFPFFLEEKLDNLLIVTQF